MIYFGHPLHGAGLIVLGIATVIIVMALVFDDTDK